MLSVGAIIDGRRDMLGMSIGCSVVETFWTDFLRDVTRRGLHGVKLVGT